MAAAIRAFRALAPETRGVLAVVFAFSCFGLQDTTARFLIGELHAMQVVWATLFGFVFFGELPDFATVAGAVIVVGAGLDVWHRERLRKLAAAAAGG